MAVNIKNPAIKRIHADVRELMKDPSDQYHAAPLESNLFEWHFTIRGPPDTEFEGGVYHGRIILPPEYPFRPPDIMFMTPSGRFSTGMKICLTISSYHPEHWQVRNHLSGCSCYERQKLLASGMEHHRETQAFVLFLFRNLVKPCRELPRPLGHRRAERSAELDRCAAVKSYYPGSHQKERVSPTRDDASAVGPAARLAAVVRRVHVQLSRTHVPSRL